MVRESWDDGEMMVGAERRTWVQWSTKDGAVPALQTSAKACVSVWILVRYR